MLHFIKNIIHAIGYSGVGLLMILENIFPPIPSEIIMPFAGFLSGEGQFSLWGVIAAGVVGSVLGTLPFYYLGYKIGEQRLKRWADEYGHWLMISSKDIDKASGWFNRHGKMAVLLGRLVPGIRTIISVPAGVDEMNFPVFLLLTFIGTAVWTGLLAYAGQLLGENFSQIQVYLDPVSYAVIGAMLLWYIVHVIRRKTKSSA